MTVPVITFFNNKGGVGKTSLVYHTAWMLSELGRRVLAVDLDPQANLTAAFLAEDALVDLWEGNPGGATTVYRSVRPLLEVGDLLPLSPVEISPRLLLAPGDLALAGFEDEVATQWAKALGGSELFRAFRILTAFWAMAQDVARAHDLEVVLFDVGPNLGALNRTAMLATDFVVVPLGGDLFSIQGLRNLGPTLERWRKGWQTRRSSWTNPKLPLPEGGMRPLGYVVQQHEVRLSRPVKAYTRWLDRIPEEYRKAMLGADESAPAVTSDPNCLGMVKHFRSLVPMAQEARRPVFLLRAADGALGAHSAAVQRAYGDFSAFVRTLLGRVGLEHEGQTPLPGVR